MGDKLLCTSLWAKSLLRKTDVIARVGGDGFIIMLVETDMEEAKNITPNFQEKFLEHMQMYKWPVTFSIGVITYRRGEANTDDLIIRAYALMYSVKKGSKSAINYAFFQQ